MDANVFIVCLREPKRADDRRADPYWEVGSFGCTTCHKSNLLHPVRRHISDGARLAFCQGGRLGARLVFLTPPVRVVSHRELLEVRWEPSLPFHYSKAPLLMDAAGKSDFPELKVFIAKSRSTLWRHKLSSRFRSRTQPLSAGLAAELVRVFEKAWSEAQASEGSLADSYLDALPDRPSWVARIKMTSPWTPQDRCADYADLVKRLPSERRPCSRSRARGVVRRPTACSGAVRR